METCAGSPFAGFRYRVRVKGGGFDRTVSTLKMKAGDAALNGISENF